MKEGPVKTAIITGSNRGLGFELSKFLKDTYRVVMTARSDDKLIEAATVLEVEDYIPLDMGDYDSINYFADKFRQKFSALDLLIHNAGIIDPIDREGPLTEITPEIMEKTFRINTFGPMHLTQQLLDLFSAETKIIIVGANPSRFRFLNRTTRYPMYRLSKLTLHGWTQVLQKQLEEIGAVVTTVHPGWIATDMGGDQAPKLPQTAAEEITELIAKFDKEYNGKFVLETELADW